jgi:SET domain-containing protein
MSAVHDDVIPLKQHTLALELRSDPIKGRGVFTKEALERNVLVEISPILLFNSEEYEAHGKYTVLDQYTYCWQGGFALALGLGSMFNHDSQPNVGFIRDIPNKLIRYVTLRPIAKDEELCISYGNHLWFEDHSQLDKSDSEEEAMFPFAEEE